MLFSTKSMAKRKNTEKNPFFPSILVFLALMGLGCESPFTNTTTSSIEPQGEGTVEIFFPHLAPTLAHHLDELMNDSEIENRNNTRAFMIAERVEIDVFDFEETLIGSYQLDIHTAQPGTGLAILALEEGFGYTIEARIFNLDSDPLNPMIQGQSTPFSVEQGQITPVYVVGFPANPTILEEGVSSHEIDIVPTLFNYSNGLTELGGEAWFQFAPQTDLTTFSVIQTETPEFSQYITLFGPDGLTIGYLDPTSGFQDFTLATIPGETYYAGAVDLESNNPFNPKYGSRFKLMFRPSIGSVPFEPNNTAEDATSISLGESQVHTFFIGDQQDVFEVELQVGDFVRLRTSLDEEELDTMLYLDSDDDPENGYLQSNDDYYDPETSTFAFSRIDYLVSETGTYYLIVQPTELYETGSYVFSAEYVPPYADGNTNSEEALELAVGDLLFENIGAFHDQDFFSINTVDGQGYTITLASSFSTDLASILTNGLGETVAQSTGDGSISFFGTGDSFLFIIRSTGGTGNYDLRLETAEFTADVLEPNDSPAEATELTLGILLSSELFEPGDYDVFSADLIEGQKYQLYIAEPFDTDVDWTLASGPDASDIVLTSDDPEPPYFQPSITGTYYLTVFSTSNQVFSFDVWVQTVESYLFTLEVEGLLVDPGEYMVAGQFFIDPWINDGDRIIDVDASGSGSMMDATGTNLRVEEVLDPYTRFTIIEPYTWYRPWNRDHGLLGNEDDFGTKLNFLVPLEAGETPQHIRLAWNGEGSMVNVFVDDVLQYPLPNPSTLVLENLLLDTPFSVGVEEHLYHITLDPDLHYALSSDFTHVWYYATEEEMRNFRLREWQLENEHITGYTDLYIRVEGTNLSAFIEINEILYLDSFGIIGTAFGDGSTDHHLVSHEDDIYTGFVELTTGGFRFRANDNWDDLVFGIEPLGTELVESSTSDDIMVDQDGLYFLTFDMSDPFSATYDLILVDSVGLIGDFNSYASSVPMNIHGTTFTWTGSNPLGNWLIRLNDTWDLATFGPAYIDDSAPVPFVLGNPPAYTSLSMLTIEGAEMTMEMTF